ncbi:[protein-PII] uridylyltransferase [Halorhodospira halochloris]|uniref:[protein-PII] uridylyltransferase n=1 Tax=Halorhodospira halochloris TaxID=1052 RepID=UPI001EE8167B|nr:[protein-PII] uridylyltransferase [Halorhodospira halochloris]MCG5547680.1 [protein-PII] uridylyltransferase [Halorhodospira halochloris]
MDNMAEPGARPKHPDGGDLADQNLVGDATTAAPLGNELVGALRDALKKFDEGLISRFRAGTSAAILAPERACYVDAIISKLWKGTLGKQANSCGCSLLAVGGYGRGELHPGSDIDVLLLHDPSRAEIPNALIEQFIAGLWDLGLEIGHSVRTIDESLQAAAADQLIATTLLESRWIAGNNELLNIARAELDSQKIWPSERFFAAKLDEQEERYSKFHDTAYNLEPNIKSSPGGLRDIQMIGWVAKRHFGSEKLHDLVEVGFLTEAEYQTLYAAQCYLWDVRFALHMIAGRREDRMLFDHQIALAKFFGYSDDDCNLAVEKFMQRYFRTAMKVARLNEMLLQHFQEEIIYRHQNPHPQRINSRFQSRLGFLEVTDPKVFSRYPFALLEVFLILEQNPDLKGVRASTIRLIRQHRTLIDDKFRRDLRCRSLFLEIMRQPQGITHALRRMHRYGVLGRYIPEFSRIAGRMQYDLFHAYTVDSHALFVVRNLRRMAIPKHRNELPQAHEVMLQVPKPELLYIAGLFHDIAKGRGGDHSELGAKDAYNFCIKHGIGAYDARLVAWLVQHHLTLSTTAQRRDISDPAVIIEMAHTVGDQTHLDCLYLLTIADIRATNPALWNTWRAALLQELYTLTRKAIRRGLSNPIDKRELIRDAQRDARRILRHRGFLPGHVRAFWRDHLPEEYFLRHNADEIAWHTEAMLNAGEDDIPLVLAEQKETGGGICIFIYALDSTDLFARCTSALDKLGLDIYEARVITTEYGYTLDSYLVLERNPSGPFDRRRGEEICQAMRAAALSNAAPPAPSSRKVPRQLKHFHTQTQINFNDDSANQRTIVELTTADRPGLLARVGVAFSSCGVRVKNAKIATMGERAEDIFFITDSQGEPLRSAEQFSCVRSKLGQYVDEEQGHS